MMNISSPATPTNSETLGAVDTDNANSTSPLRGSLPGMEMVRARGRRASEGDVAQFQAALNKADAAESAEQPVAVNFDANLQIKDLGDSKPTVLNLNVPLSGEFIQENHATKPQDLVTVSPDLNGNPQSELPDAKAVSDAGLATTTSSARMRWLQKLQPKVSTADDQEYASQNSQDSKFDVNAVPLAQTFQPIQATLSNPLGQSKDMAHLAQALPPENAAQSLEPQRALERVPLAQAIVASQPAQQLHAVQAVQPVQPLQSTKAEQAEQLVQVTQSVSPQAELRVPHMAAQPIQALTEESLIQQPVMPSGSPALGQVKSKNDISDELEPEGIHLEGVKPLVETAAPVRSFSTTMAGPSVDPVPLRDATATIQTIQDTVRTTLRTLAQRDLDSLDAGRAVQVTLDQGQLRGAQLTLQAKDGLLEVTASAPQGNLLAVLETEQGVIAQGLNRDVGAVRWLGLQESQWVGTDTNIQKQQEFAITTSSTDTDAQSFGSRQNDQSNGGSGQRQQAEESTPENTDTADRPRIESSRVVADAQALREFLGL